MLTKMSFERRKRKSTESGNENQHLHDNGDFQMKRKVICIDDEDDDSENNDDDIELLDSGLSILPNSVISLSDVNESAIKEMYSTKKSSKDRLTCEDKSKSISEDDEQNENVTSQDIIDDEIICLDDGEDDDQKSSCEETNGGGFIVNGQIQYDDETMNADLDMQYVQDIDDIDYEAPTTSEDDGIQFVNIFQDHCLVPRVFSGHIKEFITERPNRLGMILSKECGM